MIHSGIETFFEILKAGSISGAAKALFISQPALTRRIQSLEDELGYPLFKRGKGQKGIELTEQGYEFIPVARRLQETWRDALAISQIDHLDLLKLSTIDSVSKYILPHVFQRLSSCSESIRICFHNYHSFEAYDYTAAGMVDLSIISDDRYYQDIETIPLFKEPMVVLANNNNSYSDIISPDDLNPAKEILLPWNPEFQAWHDHWFHPSRPYHSFVDQMSLLEYFLSWKDTWAVAPLSVALTISSAKHISLHRLTLPPPDRIIYLIKKSNHKVKHEETFLRFFCEEIQRFPDITLFRDANSMIY